ncbi:glucosaminidase domain-containing protein [Parahaliea mediterranea]|uniref:glucosaminidase domain-containing protein n=1 Tax=Parahaliea mediterranea TaxID=651086 RepID=UPI000E2FD4D8|nr:glucosaminidase domain-containing protein [Parahaliea mediterranea]
MATTRPLCATALGLILTLGLAGCSKQDEAGAGTAEPGTVQDGAVQAGAGDKGTADQAKPAAKAGGQAATAAAGSDVEVIVTSSLESMVALLEKENWWGVPSADEPLNVPHLLIAAIHPTWQEASRNMPVQQKKALFYRLMLPLVMHANQMVMHFRNGLEQARGELADTGKVSPESLAMLKRLALLLPGETQAYVDALQDNTPELATMIDALLYRVDVVPPGLALGQAAYESGYGTSRFAVEGNSLFGQWTYKNDGIKPREQRKSKGNHQIKAFEWPFDSVRGYFINLMSHPAYEDFRRLRAEVRAAGKPMDSLVLADGLLSYSERGQAYVDSLKGMIRHNHLDIADDAVLRDEPVRFLLNEDGADKAAALRNDIEAMRSSGELQDIIERMQLD